MDLSIVIPFFNEEESVVPLCEAIESAVDPLGIAYEALLIDDGSVDATYERMLTVAERNPRFRIIKLKANFGQTAALYAGFNHARGRIIVSMDGDLQNDPRDIGAMIAKIDSGYDIVTGWRENRKDALVVRKIPSMVANWIVRKVTGLDINDNGCGIRAYRADIIKRFALYSEMHRLLPTIVGLTGARLSELKVRHHPRQFGQSKYGLSRIYKFLFDLTALRIVITRSRMPFFGFGIYAMVWAMISMGTLSLGMIHLVLNPGSSILVYVGSGVLFGSLAIFLLIIGALCDLIYQTGDTRIDSLLKVETF